MGEKKKIVVEISDIEEGEKLSSGGKRNSGELVELYTNPIPYEEFEKALVKQRTLNEINRTHTDFNNQQNQTIFTLSTMQASSNIYKKQVNILLKRTLFNIWKRIEPDVVEWIGIKVDDFFAYRVLKQEKKKIVTTQNNQKSTTETTKKCLHQTITTAEPIDRDNIIPFQHKNVS